MGNKSVHDITPHYPFLRVPSDCPNNLILNPGCSKRLSSGGLLKSTFMLKNFAKQLLTFVLKDSMERGVLNFVSHN